MKLEINILTMFQIECKL